MSKYSVAVLAAGCGRRLGRTKQSTIFEGESLLVRAIRIAVESEVGDINVVLGYDADQLLKLVPKNVPVLINRNWQEGNASSIRLAVETASQQECDGLLFTTCDQPFVDSALLRSLTEALQNTSKSVAASYYGTPGIPAIFSKQKFPELLLLHGDKGAKQLILESDAHLVSAPLARFDIDTEADLETCRGRKQQEKEQCQKKNALATKTTTRLERTSPDDAFSKEPA